MTGPHQTVVLQEVRPEERVKKEKKLTKKKPKPHIPLLYPPHSLHPVRLFLPVKGTRIVMEEAEWLSVSVVS